MKHVFPLIVLLLLAFGARAQEESDTLSLEEELAPSISLNPSQDAEKKKAEKVKAQKPVKRPKNMFYGKTSRRMILKTVKGRNVTVEKFYVLPNYEAPNPYVYYKYLLSPDGRKIVESRDGAEKYGMPLHGTYERRLNGQLREKGIYFMGTKHGRWVEYGPDHTLISKEYYDKGFYKDAKILYYDDKPTKIMEVIPIQYGRKHGMYVAYYPSGRLKEMGIYDSDAKIGQWNEFFDDPRGLRKRIIKYPQDPFEKAEPIVLKEWEPSGKLILDNGE